MEDGDIIPELLQTAGPTFLLEVSEVEKYFWTCVQKLDEKTGMFISAALMVKLVAQKGESDLTSRNKEQI